MASINRRLMLAGGGVLVAGAVSGVGYGHLTSMVDYDAAMIETRSALAADPGAAELIRFATLAPNGHNTQPWRFRVERDAITILPDPARRTPVVDPDDHHLFVALGAAAENLMLAAAAHERSGVAVFDPASQSIRFAAASQRAMPSPLYDAIPHRQSNRSDYEGRSVSPIDLATLAAAAGVPGVALALITDRAHVGQVIDLVVAGNTAQQGNAAFVRELKSWIRFNPQQALATRDGLFSAASGSPIVPAWAGPWLYDRVFDVTADNDRYARQLRSSAGIAVFTGARADPAHWVAVGHAVQRFALQATALGLATAFVNQPVEVPHLRPALAALIGVPAQRPDIVMRFGHAPPMPFSARRAVSDMLI
nr:nitroreductase family protein [Polymorphobacter sp.]